MAFVDHNENKGEMTKHVPDRLDKLLDVYLIPNARGIVISLSIIAYVLLYNFYSKTMNFHDPYFLISLCNTIAGSFFAYGLLRKSNAE
jgi:hypothetical protein